MVEHEKQQPEQLEENLPSGKPAKAKKVKDPDHMKYPYLIYGAAFGLVIGLIIGYYAHNSLWTLLCGLIGTIIGGGAQLLYKKK